MFKWLFGSIEEIRLKPGFTVEDSNGELIEYVYDKYDCSICAAPGFTCKNIEKCPHSGPVTVISGVRN